MVELTPQEETAGYIANGAITAICLLARSLKKNGALLPNQYEELRATIQAEGAQRHRPDYGFLQVLLQTLEGTVPKAH